MLVMSCAHCPSFRLRNPPMFTRPSFFADIVQPSPYLKSSRAMSKIDASAYAGSRSLMKKQFSAKRQASKNRGIR